MGLFSQGRKFALTAGYLVGAALVMGGSFWLALRGKIGPDWVSVVNVYLVTTGGAVGAFQVANAWITTKAPGIEPPAPPPSTEVQG